MASQIFGEIKFVKEMKACDILAMVMFKLLTHGPTFFWIHNSDFENFHDRSLSPMMMTWFRPLPNDPVLPALWVSNIMKITDRWVWKSTPPWGPAFKVFILWSCEGEFCYRFCRAASSLGAGCCRAVWRQLGSGSYQQVVQLIASWCKWVQYNIAL